MLLAGGALDHGPGGAHTVRGTVEAVLAALCYSGFLFILRRSGKSTPVLPSYTVVIVASAAASWAGGLLWHGFSFTPRLAAVGWLALAAICGQVAGWLLVAYYGSSHSGFDLQLRALWVFAWRSRLAIMRV